MSPEKKLNLYSFSLATLEGHLSELGLKAFAARQIFHWLYNERVEDIESWTNISKKAREILLERYEVKLPRIAWEGQSRDETVKFLIGFADGKSVEAVAIPAPNRMTLCLSSQVGCAVGCSFCHTGTQGLTRNLDCSEIVGQYLLVDNWLKDKGFRGITNIVYMGQGEPLHNFAQVKSATQVFLEPHGLGLGQRRITLSTSGLVPQLKRLDEFPPVNLAISLHAASNQKRTKLMPINSVHNLEKLFETIKSIPLKAHRYITFEYLLISDLNDGPEDIRDLCALLPKKVSKINLIPFNEYPGSQYKRPSRSTILWFRDQLMTRGYVCTIRMTKGDDILAACGQLKTQVEAKPARMFT